ncbi:hypothetical protein [Halosimplex aquaticum]|uniref:hypothetical protein n=1 Tax=Halosimplex aquaticum TaxID=3026162 RepID=UPI002367C27A|nr:hypothetical protein [Halosimplex aquaticum]
MHSDDCHVNRRQVLASASALVTFGGCVAAPGSSDTDSPAPTPAGPAISCPETPENPSVSIPPWPERPNSFTAETAGEFAQQFERAFVVRRTLRETRREIVWIDVDTSPGGEAGVSSSGDGWVVQFGVIGPNYRHPPTTTPDHADGGFYTVSYLLTDERVVRATGTEGVDPIENGSAIRCPPS